MSVKQKDDTATELTNHHQNSEKKVESEPMYVDQEEKGHENVSNPNTIDVFLWNVMKRTDFRNDNKYQYHTKVLFLVAIEVIMGVPFFIQHGATVSIVMYLLMIAFCIVALMFAKCKAQDLNGTISKINDILDIPNENDEGLYDINRKYYGVALILFTALYSLHLIIYEIWGGDMLFHATWTGYWIPGCWAIWICVNCYFVIDKKHKKKINNEKIKLLNRYKQPKHDNNHKIKQIDENVTKRLEEWKKTKNANMRKNEIIAVVCFVVVLRFVVMNTFNGTWLDILINDDISTINNVPILYFIFSVYTNIIDTIIMSYCFYCIQTRTIYDYLFIWVITDEMSRFMDSDPDEINDIIAWWELRKYYSCCVINSFVIGFNKLIFVCLLFCFTAIIWMILTFQVGQYQWVIINCIMVLYFGILSFKTTTICVRYHNAQLSHISTLNRIKLLFQINHVEHFNTNDDTNIYKYKMEAAQGIFDIIEKDILTTSKPLSILGVRMNNNFMLFLRGTVIAFTIAVIVEISAS
eukprot:81407_1